MRQSHESWGSSPLTRGKPASDRGHGTPDGLIPAHAGKTESARIKGKKLGAHPRSRGENYSKIDATWGAMGSSPLTRGKHLNDVASQRSSRLIPAHAGKT